MEEYVAALEQAFITYRQEIEACQKKSKPNFGHCRRRRQ